MVDRTEIEGTGEELEQVLKAMPKRRFRVLLLPEEAVTEREESVPFYETASAEEWTRAFSEWVQSHPADGRSLSDDAATRDSIYSGRA